MPPEPEPAPLLIENELAVEAVEDEPAPFDNGWDNWGISVGKKRKKEKLTLRSSFDKRNYLSMGDPKAEMLQSFEPQYNTTSRQNFTAILLAHARLYTFAEMRLIQPLSNLALHKLHKTLRGFQLYDRRVSDVLELARYAYDHGPDRTSNGTVDDLRDLIVQYIACEIDTIGKHKDFKQLMEEGGEFVGDIWGIMQKYLVSGPTKAMV